MQSVSVPISVTADEAASYMDRYLRNGVRCSLEKCLNGKPRDPILFLARSLRQLREEEAASKHALEPSDASAAHTSVSSSKPLHWTAPPSVRLNGGVKYELRPLAHDFRRAAGKPSDAEDTAPPSVFPSVQYREALTSYEVASSLRQLHVKEPTAPLVLVVESPDPTSGAFFYEGMAYCCTSATAKTAKQTPPPSIAALQEALGAEKVSDIGMAIRAAATGAVASVRVHLLPPLQVDYLAVFDLLDFALRTADQAAVASTPDSPAPPASRTLPSVLFVSYRPDSAHLTYARLLASYGPLYEAAQRACMQEFRAAQLVRKRTYTFAYALEYWAKVQRRRQASAAAPRALHSPAKLATSIGATPSTGEGAELTSPDESAIPSAAVDKRTAAAASGDRKRAAAKPAKRKILSYEAAHQAEDDVFLVVVRRLEHAAATLIQSVYRGYRERRRYAEARAAPQGPAGALTADSPSKTRSTLKMGQPSLEPSLPPLLRACLECLLREGDAYGSIWGDHVTSPPPESRRYWIYRPVQHHNSGSDTVQQGVVGPTGRDAREGWVQEELLLPPWRVTQPRLHLNLFQRLREYLVLAQCTSLQDSVQLLKDSPGMSVLQRRAYDGIKSVCLNLFHAAYAELRQRQPSDLPPSFSAYMRQMHASQLGWLSTPHDCSLLVRAMQTTTFNAALYPRTRSAPRPRSSGSHSAIEDAMSAVVQSQLAANEAILIVPHSLSASEAVAPSSELEVPAVWEVAPQIYMTQQPLLPLEEWVRTVKTLWQSTGEGAADARASSVEWMTTASFPLCCVNGTPVAAVRRFDTQRVEGVPPYDSFVPRLHASAGEVGHASAKGAPVGDSAAPVAPAEETAAAMQAWMQGDLARAADVGLKVYIQKSLSSERGVVYFKAAPLKGGIAKDAFTAVSPTANLFREVLQTRCQEGAPELRASAGEKSCAPNWETGGSQSAADTELDHPAQSEDGWEPVKEAGAQETEAAAPWNLSKTSSSVTLLSNSAGALCRSPLIPAPASLITEHLAPSSTLQPSVKSEANGALGKDAVAVLTADDVATEVKAALSGGSFQHTRISLRFFAGPRILESLDAFLDRVAATLQQEAHKSALVLAMELPSQGFYALAAALLAFRLHDKRDIVTWVNSKATAPSTVLHGAQCGDVFTDPHVSFLTVFHDVLEQCLPAPSRPRASGQSTAVQAAAQHVSQLMHYAPLPQLNLVARLSSAVKEARAAIDPSPAIVHATQLAEQYAMLVLLDYYLWSSLASFTPTGAPLRGHGVAVRMTVNFAFTAFVKTVPAALDWIARIDPWQTSSPDTLHLRYSNALRRWDDKHYVCFGEY
ncbi:hypothetical protein LSCM1_01034 [Leishmania martiniquensis]|uniref:Uncharacterized protein n=1 Tax=Leishmania martiniquensis TaxID=1580590 RepID=A0A836FPV4_9TRYP|nr:hypothetical protein LSCM1_01034 [Leishmania martiniquensis]